MSITILDGAGASKSLDAAGDGGATPYRPTHQIAANVGNGWTPHHRLTTAADNVSLKGAAGCVTGMHLVNNNATYPIRVKFYDKATAPAPATDTPKFCLTIPAAISATQPSVVTMSGPPAGTQFLVGIAYAVVKGVADNDATAVLANDGDVNLLWQ